MIEREVRTLHYFKVCLFCGQEFRVEGKNTISATKDNCPRCTDRIAEEKVKQELESEFIGAKIVKCEPCHNGEYTNSDELKSLTVKTSRGKIVKFTAGGYDERYIEYEEEK